jgi:hypothetical protein
MTSSRSNVTFESKLKSHYLSTATIVFLENFVHHGTTEYSHLRDGGLRTPPSSIPQASPTCQVGRLDDAS